MIYMENRRRHRSHNEYTIMNALILRNNGARNGGLEKSVLLPCLKLIGSWATAAI